jgi:hypothetical protein
VQLERFTPPIAVVNGSLLWITREDGGKLMRQPLEGGAAEAIVEGNGINLANVDETATDGSTLVMLRRATAYTGEGCVNDPGTNGMVTGFPGARFEIVSLEPGSTGPANPYDEGVQRCQRGPSSRVHLGGGHLFWLESGWTPKIFDFDLSTGDLRDLANLDTSYRDISLEGDFDVTLDGEVVIWSNSGVTVQSVKAKPVIADLGAEILEQALGHRKQVAAFTTPIELAQDAALTP